MSLQKQLPRHHLNFSPHNHSLILQFVLKDILNASSEVKKLILVASQLNRDNSSQLHQYILKILLNLSGDSVSLTTWDIKKGLFIRINEELHLLHNLQEPSSDNYSPIVDIVHNCWLDCLYLKQLLQTKQEDQYLHIKKRLKKFYSGFQKVLRIIKKLMDDFSGDENFIFFLLRHKEEVENEFGKGFLKRKLAKLYPEGLKGMSNFLVSKYSLKGFEHLTPFILQKIEELKR